MLTRLLPSLVLVLLPAAAWARQDEPQPTPAEAAQAMIPCLVEHGYPAEVRGELQPAEAVIADDEGDLVVLLSRGGPIDPPKFPVKTYWHEDSPIRPPLMLRSGQPGTEDDPAWEAAVACFDAVDPPG